MKLAKGFHWKREGIVLFLLVACVFVILLSVMVGTIPFSFSDTLRALGQRSDNPLANVIIHAIRLPRALNGVLVGASLGVSGCLLQAVLRNPLASPQIVGVNAGAGLFAVGVMILFPNRMDFIPLGAFLGAMLATSFVSLLALLKRGLSPVTLILSGVAVSALLNALTSALMFIHSDELEVTYFWLLGSLSGRGFSFFYRLLPYTLFGLLLVFFLSPKLTLFSLGDEMSASLGLHVKRYRLITLGAAALLAGSAVSVAGTIGFVGLIAPHVARLFVGGDYRYLTITSALCGAILVVLSDLISRTAFQPVELSVGIVTSLLGAPFFLFLLFRRNEEGL